MSEDFEAMLEKMDERFDLSFDDPSEKEESVYQPELLPKINPEKQSPESSTNEECRKQDSTEKEQQLDLSNVCLVQLQPDSQTNTEEIEMLPFSSSKSDEDHSHPFPEETQLFQSDEEEVAKSLPTDRPIEFDEQPVQNEDQEEQISYRCLTEKLQLAMSRLKRTPTASSEFASRQKDFMRRKKSDLNLLRAQQQKQERLRCTRRPLINSKSTQILTNYKPIQNRYKEVLVEKKKKIDLEVAWKKEKDSKEEEAILRNMNQHQKSIKSKLGKDVRSKEEYYECMKTWTEVRDKKVEELSLKQGKNSLETTTFKPSINDKSQVMMKKKTTRVPVYEQEPKVRKIQVDKNCTFKPNLNKALKK